MSDRAAQLVNFNVASTSQSGGGGGSTPIEGGNLADVSIKEGKGMPIEGVSMPTGGVGLTGWLSAIWSHYGTDATAAAPPTGGAGIRGWLSSLVLSAGENPPAATGLVDVPPASGTGALGWLSGIYNAIKSGQKTHKATLQEVTSAAPLTIAAGATEISLANIGTANAIIKSDDMVSASTLYPVSDGGVSITWRANPGGTLPAVTVTASVGAVVQASVID